MVESWFKLLTYKDEYEVARLHLKVDYGRVARDLGIEGPYSVTYHLHPPVLRRIGCKKKLALGKPYELAFRALRGMKRLRGTPFDVFGWTRVRRLERALARWYEDVLDTIAQHLRAENRAEALEIVRLAEGIRGYEGIKEARAAELRPIIERKLAAFAAPA